MKKIAMALTLASLLGACDDNNGAEDEEFTDSCGAPSYGGGATDEAWKAILDAYAQAEVGSAQAVTVISPAANATVAATGVAPKFEWTSPIALGPVHPRAIALAVPERPEPSWLEGALDDLAGFFVGTAHAHLPPITGDVYFVELKIAGATCPIARNFTTKQTWDLDAGEWTAIKAHPGVSIEVVVTSAYLSENRITEGPYRPATNVAFEVE